MLAPSERTIGDQPLRGHDNPFAAALLDRQDAPDTRWNRATLDPIDIIVPCGIFSVLVDGDDHNDPVADNIRGTLDGHIVLDRAIFDQGRFPAVNVLSSISRLAQNVWTREQQALVVKLKAMVARYEDTRDLRLMGGYQHGQDSDLDQVVALVPKLYDALVQSPDSPPSKDAFRELAQALQAK